MKGSTHASLSGFIVGLLDTHPSVAVVLGFYYVSFHWNNKLLYARHNSLLESLSTCLKCLFGRLWVRTTFVTPMFYRMRSRPINLLRGPQVDHIVTNILSS